MLRRKILLQGKMSLTNFLYADSYVALDRLDDWMRHGLLESHKPIGFLMQERRLETFREIVGCGREPADGLGPYFNVEETDGMIWRTYKVINNGQADHVDHREVPGEPFPGVIAFVCSN